MFVSLGAMRASLAFEVRLGDAILRCCVPTVLAAVGGVPGVDLDPGAPSLFRFGAQNRDEPAPAGVTDASAQPGLRPGTVGQILAGVVGVGHGFGPPQHVGDLQILHHQQVVAPTRVRACLWWKSLRWLAILRCRAATVSRLRSRFSIGVWRAAIAAARWPTDRRRYGPSADCRRAHRHWWWRNSRCRHRCRPGDRSPAANSSARHHRTGPASSADPDA